VWTRFALGQPLPPRRLQRPEEDGDGSSIWMPSNRPPLLLVESAVDVGTGVRRLIPPPPGDTDVGGRSTAMTDDGVFLLFLVLVLLSGLRFLVLAAAVVVVVVLVVEVEVPPPADADALLTPLECVLGFLVLAAFSGTAFGLNLALALTLLLDLGPDFLMMASLFRCMRDVC
jgi:hypothetical protein